MTSPPATPADPIEQLLAALNRASVPDGAWIARWSPDGTPLAAWRASESPVAMRQLLWIPSSLAWRTRYDDAHAVHATRWREMLERPRGTHVTLVGPRDAVLDTWFVPEDTSSLAAALDENRRLVDAIRTVVPVPPTLDELIAGIAASQARIAAIEAEFRAEDLRDPIAALLAALDDAGKPPLAWVVAHAPDGDITSAIQRAWDASENPAAMRKLLDRARMLDHPTAHQNAILEAEESQRHASLDRRARLLRTGFPDAPTLAALLAASRAR